MGPMKITINIDTTDIHGVPNLSEMAGQESLSQCVGVGSIRNAVFQDLYGFAIACPRLF